MNKTTVKYSVYSVLLLIAGILSYITFIHRYYVDNLTPQQAADVLSTSTQPPYFIDVRTRAEYLAGHPTQTINVPLYYQKNKQYLLADDFTEQVKQHHTQPQDKILVICASGSRSKKAANLLAKAGFSQVYNVSGGYQQWRQQKLPTTK